MRRALFVASVLTASCGLELAGSIGDTPDAAPPGSDGSVSTEDGGVTEDGAIITDGGADADGAIVDGAASVVPSHTSATFDPNAADLTGATIIDTSARTVTVNGAVANVRFEAIGDATVLFVGSWTVNVNVRVNGTKPLIVLA